MPGGRTTHAFQIDEGAKLKVGELLLVRETDGAGRLIVRVTAVKDRAGTCEEVARTKCLDAIASQRVLQARLHRFDVEGLPVKPLDDAAPLIAALGAEEFEARERATERLIEAGESAREAIERAADSKDPEVAARARHILATLRSPVERLGIEGLAELFRKTARGGSD